MTTFIDKLVFPAPAPTYNKDSFKKILCWIPWNEAVSPARVDDDKYAEGIPCLWLPAPHAAGVILFCHGNAEDLGMCFPFVRHMRDQFKMNVLAVEYPGYGLLHDIAVSEAALKEAALTAFRFILDELKVAYEQVILLGRSVGSGPSVYLASRFPVGGLILVAAFASVREAAKSLVGNVIAQVLVERFPNISLIGNVSCPTLFIHGEKDSLVPPSHSVALFKMCRARKLLITPPSMEHNTNLFTDASYLAVPAINFFGLPGYQQEKPPEMKACFFEDGRQAFLLRRSARRKAAGVLEIAPPLNGHDSTAPWSQWFFFCGCPTSLGRAKQQSANSQMGRPYEWEAEKETDASSEVDFHGPADPSRGNPDTAARETAAASAALKAAAAARDTAADLKNPEVWGDMQDFREEEIDRREAASSNHGRPDGGRQ